jgi:hypothetical protein
MLFQRYLSQTTLLLLLTLTTALCTPLIPEDISAQTRPPDAEQQLPNVERLPIPDPTRLTAQGIRDAVVALKDVIYTRLEGMDKALQLLQARSDRFPAELDVKISTVRDLLTERFKGIELQFEGIQLQFKERDTRVEQTARDSKTAVDAALQAAKEAVEKQNAASSQAATKSELAFNKSIDQLAELFRGSAKSLEDKITSVAKVFDDKIAASNDRLTRIEAATLGQRTSVADSRDNTMLILGLIGAFVGVIGIVAAIVAAVRHKP